MFSNRIQISSLFFVSKVRTATDSVNEFTPETGELPEADSNVQTLLKYREELAKVSGLLQSFQSLMVKDMAAISGMGISLIQLDQNTLRTGIANSFGR